MAGRVTFCFECIARQIGMYLKTFFFLCGGVCMLRRRLVLVFVCFSWYGGGDAASTVSGHGWLLRCHSCCEDVLATGTVGAPWRRVRLARFVED